MIGLSIRLDLPQGEIYRRLYAFIPWWALATLMLGGLAAGLWFLLRPRVPAAWNLGATRATRPALVALIVSCTLIVIACDGYGLVHGFFRQDDFSFLQVTRETEGLGRQLLLIHNDHLSPLYRLETWLLTGLAGPDASTAALAGWFRACTFLTCVGLLLAGSWVLHELGCSRLGLLSLALFLWIWPGWGEFTAGYFSCTGFLQILTLGLGATAAMLRGFNRDSARWLAGSLLLATAAAGIDVSGVHVFLTVAILGLTRTWPLTGVGRPWRYLFVLVTVFVAVVFFYFLAAPHAQTPREFVQNPHGTSLSIGTLFANLRLHPFAAGLIGIAAPGGLLLGLVTPTFLQRAVQNEQVHPGLFWGFFCAELLLLAVLAVIGPKVWRRLTVSDRFLAGALVANAALSLCMVIVARVNFAINVPIPLWHARYMLIPTAWGMLAAVLVVDRLWLSRPQPDSMRIPAWLYAAGVAGVWLVASCWQLEKTLLPQPLAYVPRGRWGNVNNAQARASQYHDVLADLVEISRYQGGPVMALPDPARWRSAFYSRYSILEWGTDYTSRGVTYLFWDLSAATPGLHLHGHWAPTDSFAPAARQFLARYSWLREAFAAPEATVTPSPAPAIVPRTP